MNIRQFDPVINARSCAIFAGLVAGAAFLSQPAAAQSTQSVAATASIYNSGEGSSLRDIFDVTGATDVTVAASGTITITPTFYNDPDGYGSLAISHDVSAANGLSGISLPTGRAGALVGVFLGATDPTSSDLPPATLSYTIPDLTLTSYAPLLDQVFFVGDGLTGDGSGASQLFAVPTGATRLALGIADAQNYQGTPNAYQDNFGSFTATVSLIAPTTSAAPEPASWIMMILGFGVIGAVLRLASRKSGHHFTRQIPPLATV